jgi:hypothetical protein
VAFTAFLLLGAAWAMALPVNGTYDESHHIARGYGVYSGQWLAGEPGEAGRLQVPASLLPVNPDCMWDPRPDWRPASCQQPQPTDGHRLVPAPSGAARYPPLYYLLVGTPIRMAPDTSGVIVGRLLSVLLSALLLAAAVKVGVSAGLPTLAAAATLVVTPMVANLIGAINPNGMEISAAILLFVALLALAYQPPDGQGPLPGAPVGRRTLLMLAGVSAFLLLTLRHLGPVLLGVDLLAVALLVGRERVAAEFLRRDTRTVLGGWVAAGALMAIGWLVVAGSPAADVPRGPMPRLSAGQVVDGILTFRIPFYIEQVVGRFSYGETRISPWATLLWYGLIAVVAVPAVWRGRWRLRLVLGGLVATSVAMLALLELTFLPKGRWYAHGRYALPMLVGVVLVAARARPATRWYVPAGLVLATAPVHLYALGRVMIRFQSGTAGGLTSIGDGPWRSPFGPIVPLACALLGVALLSATVLKGHAAR